MKISKLITRYTMIVLFSLAFYFSLIANIFPGIASGEGLMFWIMLMIVDLTFALQ